MWKEDKTLSAEIFFLMVDSLMPTLSISGDVECGCTFFVFFWLWTCSLAVSFCWCRFLFLFNVLLNKMLMYSVFLVMQMFSIGSFCWDKIHIFLHCPFLVRWGEVPLLSFSCEHMFLNCKRKTCLSGCLQCGDPYFPRVGISCIHLYYTMDFTATLINGPFHVSPHPHW